MSDPESTPFKFVNLKKAATEKQKEVRRHSFVMFILAGARKNLLHYLPQNHSIALKIDNFFSELRQIEYAVYKRNKEKLDGNETKPEA